MLILTNINVMFTNSMRLQVWGVPLCVFFLYFNITLNMFEKTKVLTPMTLCLRVVHGKINRILNACSLGIMAYGTVPLASLYFIGRCLIPA